MKRNVPDRKTKLVERAASHDSQNRCPPLEGRFTKLGCDAMAALFLVFDGGMSKL